MIGTANSRHAHISFVCNRHIQFFPHFQEWIERCHRKSPHWIETDKERKMDEIKEFPSKILVLVTFKSGTDSLYCYLDSTLMYSCAPPLCKDFYY